jgi:Nuclease-related domain
MTAAGASSRAYYEQTRAAWRREVRLPLLVFVAFVLGIVGSLVLFAPGDKRFEIGLLLGAGAGFLYALWDSPPQFIENWREGAEGEERTARELAKLDARAWHTSHDLEDEYGNLDHVVVGPAGVFLLDSKSWSGRIAIEEGVIVQRRSISPRNDFHSYRLARRMRGAAVSLRRRLAATTGLDQRVTAVVVIWGAFDQGIAEDDQVVYISGERVAAWFTEQPPRLERRAQNLFALALESGLAVSHRELAA